MTRGAADAIVILINATNENELIKNSNLPSVDKMHCKLPAFKKMFSEFLHCFASPVKKLHATHATCF